MGDLTLVGVGHLVIATGLSIHVLLYKDRPVSSVLWLAVLWAFPYLGALGYLSFGIDRVRRGAEDRETTRALLVARAEGHPGLERPALEASGAERVAEGPARHIFRATEPAVRGFRVLPGNRVDLLVDGDEFYPALREAIEAARSSIHLQTYIFARDRTGREIRDRLADRARDGVSVRLLYDRFGSTWAHFTGFFQPAVRAGVRVKSISQANPLKGRFQINLRNHRKIAVIDGRVGFLGGINIADRNVSAYRRGAPDRDYHVRLRGPAVADLQFQFLQDWHFATGQSPERILEEADFPDTSLAGEELVQIVPGGPEPAGRGLADAFFAAIAAAEGSVDLVTPYFVPDEPILQALRYAAIRGVRVRLVVPRKSNHWYTGYATRALYGPLLEEGVQVFERRPPFMHSKALVVDGVYAMVGSANLDYRSLHLNFELNAEVVGEGFVGRLARQVDDEIDHSVRVRPEAYRSRPFHVRLLENGCRLFQPVL